MIWEILSSSALFAGTIFKIKLGIGLARIAHAGLQPAWPAVRMEYARWARQGGDLGLSACGDV